MKRRLPPANDRALRPRPRVRAILILAAAALALAAIPEAPSAAVRTGSVRIPRAMLRAERPVLDVSGPSPCATTTSAGTLRITWTYYNDVRTADPSEPPSRREASLALDAPSFSAPRPTGVVGGTRPDATGYLVRRVEAEPLGRQRVASGTGTMSDDGHVITAEFTNPMLAGHDWQHGRRLTWESATDDRRFWFDGYASPPGRCPADRALRPSPARQRRRHRRQPGHDDQRRGAVHERSRRDAVGLAPSWADTLRVANDGGFRAAKTFPVQEDDPLASRRVRPRAPAQDGLPAIRQGGQNFTDDIILDQTKPTVSSATVGASGTATSAQPSRRQPREDPDLPRPHPCQGRDVRRRQGSVRAQQAAPERASQVRADQPIQGGPRA